MPGLQTCNEARRLRRGLRLLAGGAACVLVLAIGGLGSTDAFAATGHVFSSALTEAPAGTSLVEPGTVAVDRGSGRVFVSDLGAGVVDVLDSGGAFVTQFGNGEVEALGIAVDEFSGRVYVADAFNEAVLVYAPDGAGGYEQVGEWTGASLPGKSFGEVRGVAVDESKGPSAGDVYVVDGEDPKLSEGVVDVFKPKPTGPEEDLEGSLVRVLSKGGMEEPNGIAIDGESGRVLVADGARGAVYEYSAAGAFEGKMNGSSSPLGGFGKGEAEGNVSAVAIDPVSHDLLIAEAERAVVEEFTQAGEWAGWIVGTLEAPLVEPLGVALDGSGRVFVADALAVRVDVYGPGVVVPDATTEKASKPTRTTAALNGVLNGEGKPGHYFFQWGTTPALGSSTSPAAFPGGQEPVTASLTELHAGTTYFFRLVAENENGASYGVIRELTTPPAVEKLSTGLVKNLEPESVTLTGTLSPNGFDAHYYFQWGATTAYGHTIPDPPGTDAGEEKGAVSAEAALAGLTPNTVYHYRLVASNSFGTTLGADQKFQTSGPPRITFKPVTGIGHEAATLNAEINADELATTYHFEYGETTSYGTETPLGGANIGSGATPVPVSAALTGLKLGVTYHYRVIASNSVATTTGPDRAFTTIPPALTTAWATGVSPTEATLNATINPLGNDTTYYFQYGTEACAPHPEACTSSPAPPGEDIGSGEEAVPKTLKLTALTPDTIYHYRVIAVNTLGTAEGTEHTITTPKPVTPLALPDGRAWEMVTPPDKEGAPVEALTNEGGIILASNDGDKLTYVVDGGLGEHVEGNRSPELQQVLANRGATSWTSQDIATPSDKAKGLNPGQAPEYQFFSPDLGIALDEPQEHQGMPEPPLAPGVTQATPYLRDNATSLFTPLVTEANTAEGAVFGGRVHFVSASPDLGSSIISSAVALLGAGSGPGLYEWTAGELRFVSRLPGGAPAANPELGYQGRVLDNAVSADGSRSIWTNREDLSNRGGHLYLHDATSGQTLLLDAAQGVSEPTKGSAQFQTASSDDSRVFFTDKQKLTPDSTAEPAQGVGKPDLYECDRRRRRRQARLPAPRPDRRPQRRRARVRAGLHLRRR